MTQIFCLLLFVFNSASLWAQWDSRLLLRNSETTRSPASKSSRLSNKKPEIPPSEMESADDQMNVVLKSALPPKKVKNKIKTTEDSLVTVVVGPQESVEKKDLKESKIIAATEPTIPPKASLPNESSSNSNSPVTAAPVTAEDPKLLPQSDPSPAKQFMELVTGDSQSAVESYKEQVHPDDIRLNQVELQIDFGSHYTDSKSNYAFRNYTIYDQSYGLWGRFWASPLVGVSMSTNASLNASVSAGQNSVSEAKHETNRIALELRQFYGMSRKAPSVEYGFDYFDYKFEVSATNTLRNTQKVQGLGVHLLVRYPSSPNFSWTFGGRIFPRVSHSESAAGAEIISGDGPKSSRIHVSIGGEFKLERQHQIIMDLSMTQDQHQYSGTASATDPETGLRPSGVSVTNTQVYLSLGYRWGQ